MQRLVRGLRQMRPFHAGARTNRKAERQYMIKTIVKIDGMMCGMCETHIRETIRKNFDVKKVTASRKKKEAVILSENLIDHGKLKAAIDQTGYSAGEITEEN